MEGENFPKPILPVKDKWEHSFENDIWEKGRKEIPRVLDFIQRYKAQMGHNVLDIGSGAGRHLVPLAEMGFAVTGLELTEAGIAKTKIKLREKNLQANLAQGDLHHMPFKNETFDSAISVQSFQYDTTPQQSESSFNEAARVLKPGGIFFLRIRSEKFRIGRHVAFHKDGRIESKGFSLENLKALADASGFEIIEEPIDSWEDDENGNIIKEGQWNIVMRKKVAKENED